METYVNIKDIRALATTMLADPRYQHKSEDFYTGICAFESQIYNLSKKTLPRADLIEDISATEQHIDMETIGLLRAKTGVGMQLCKEAFDYAKQRHGDMNMMIAYIKAKSFALYSGGSFDDKVAMFMRGMEKN